MGGHAERGTEARTGGAALGLGGAGLRRGRKEGAQGSPVGRLRWLWARVGPEVRSAARAQEEKSDKERWQHLADLADFALAMKDTLTNINNQSFNNFMLRIGRGHRGGAGAQSSHTCSYC